MYNKVTISGRICTGKTTLFFDLQQKLVWPTFSASYFFRDYAAAKHLSLDKASEQSDQLTQIIDYGMGELLRKKDSIIFEGWMTGIVARELPNVLRVLLTCADDIRAKRFSRRENLSVKDALRKINERETNLFKKLEEIYHRNDFVNPVNYNMVIDTTKSTPKKSLDLVLQALGYFSANGQQPHA